jgi:hypothetical protein
MDKEKKILAEPKSAARFARLVNDACGHEDAAVHAFARRLLTAVEEGERSLDDVMNHLKTFKANRQWVQTLDKLLKRQEEELGVESFTPHGKDLEALEAVSKALVNLEKILT